MTVSSPPRADSDLKSTYCFCAHMHEIIKYFLFTEIHKQFLNQLSGASRQSSICLQIDRVTIPSESLPLVPSASASPATLRRACLAPASAYLYLLLGAAWLQVLSSAARYLQC